MPGPLGRGMECVGEIEVREAGSKHLAGALSVFAAAFEPHRRVYRPPGDVDEHARQRFALGTRLVALVDGAVVATGPFEVHAEHLHLIGLAVHPSHQRQGIGKALVRRVLELAPSLARSTVALDTIREAGAVPAFLAMGFRIVSEAPSSYFLSDSSTEV